MRPSKQTYNFKEKSYLRDMTNEKQTNNIPHIGQKTSGLPSFSLIGARAAKINEWLQLFGDEFDDNHWFHTLLMEHMDDRSPHHNLVLEIFDRHLEDNTPTTLKEELEAALK